MPRKPLVTKPRIWKKHHKRPPIEDWMVEELEKSYKSWEYFIQNYVTILNNKTGELSLFDPYEYQWKMLRHLDDGFGSIFLLPRQVGKALALDTPLPTPDGWTTIGEVSVGDYVIGKNGHPVRVLYKSDIHYKPTYKITFCNGEEIVCCEDHLWVVGNRDWDHRQKIISTSELYNIRKNGLYVENHNGVFLGTSELPVDPYLFGYWLGDGHAESGRITCHKDDKLVLDGYQQKNIYTDKRNDNVITITMSGLFESLNQLNVIKNKKIPNIYLRSSHEQRLELLAGIVDSDGYVNEKGSIEITQKRKNLITDICELLSSLGIKYTKPRVKIINGVEYYRLFFTPNKHIPLRHKRKLERLRNNHRRDIKNFYIKSIERIETRPTQCISVDADDHMFLCGKSMIPTHNTTVITAYLVWFAIFHPDKSIGVISKDANAAKDVIDRTKTVIEYLPHFMVPNVTRWNVKDIGFDNGSTIEAKAATKTSFRGESLSILYFDEMAFILNNIEDSLWNSIFPAMTAGGEEGMSRRKLIITSTPNGSENLFARLYFSAERAGDDALLRPLHIKNEEIPGREPGSDFEKKILASGVMTREQFEQEYYCSFTVSNKPTLIRYNIIEQIKPVKPYRRTSYGDIYCHTNKLKGHDILLVTDVSEGVGQDYSTIVGFDLTTFDQIFEFSDNQMNIHQLSTQIRTVVKQFAEWTGKEIYYTIESNSVGLGVLALIDAAEDAEFDKVAYLVSEPGKKGFRMTQSTKARGCATLKHLVESNILRLKSQAILSEARFFIKQGQTFKAQQGKHDDLMMSAVLACLAIERIAQWDEAVYDTFTARGMVVSQFADIDIGTTNTEDAEMPVLSSATISDDEEFEIV